MRWGISARCTKAMRERLAAVAQVAGQRFLNALRLQAAHDEHQARAVVVGGPALQVAGRMHQLLHAMHHHRGVGAFHIEDSDEEAQEGNVEEEAKETVEEIIPVETAPVVVPVECKFNSLFLLVKQRK